jgi:hypothetical protein
MRHSPAYRAGRLSLLPHDANESARREVIVVPVLVSKGAVSRDKIPGDLTGMPVIYSGEPLLPHPAMSRWVEARVRSAAGRSAPE